MKGWFTTNPVDLSIGDSVKCQTPGGVKITGTIADLWRETHFTHVKIRCPNGRANLFTLTPSSRIERLESP